MIMSYYEEEEKGKEHKSLIWKIKTVVMLLSLDDDVIQSMHNVL